MAATIFFSWQADTPTKEGRNLIERALGRAISGIGADAVVEDAVRELEIDRDTKGVAGSPPIVDTIFKKIDNAAVFVPDLTFVGSRLDGRLTPNPNVLIEYGWALKSLGYGRIVPVMNVAFGEPTDDAMPFNMRHLRNPIRYNCPTGATEETRKLVRGALAKELERGLRQVVASQEFQESLPKPPALLPFPAAQPRNGQGKFRAKGQPLGITDDAFLMADRRELFLADGAAMWLRVMPSADTGRTWLITELKKVATEPVLLLPIMRQSYMSFDYLRGEDGFGVYAMMHGEPKSTTSAVYTFNTGEIWSVDTYLMDTMRAEKRNAIPFVESQFGSALHQYSSFLAKLGVEPPYKWVAGMENLKGRGIVVPAPPGRMFIEPGPRGACLTDSVVVEGLLAPGEAAAKALRPFFVKLFDSCGVERPQWLDG